MGNLKRLRVEVLRFISVTDTDTYRNRKTSIFSVRGFNILLRQRRRNDSYKTSGRTEGKLVAPHDTGTYLRQPITQSTIFQVFWTYYLRSIDLPKRVYSV